MRYIVKQIREAIAVKSGVAYVYWVRRTFYFTLYSQLWMFVFTERLSFVGSSGVGWQVVERPVETGHFKVRPAPAAATKSCCRLHITARRRFSQFEEVTKKKWNYSILSSTLY